MKILPKVRGFLLHKKKSLKMGFRALKFSGSVIVTNSQNDCFYCKCSSTMLQFYPFFF